jgi:hypothetical protein
MALPIPLILAAGAAVVILGGKKKKSGSSTATSTPTNSTPGSRPSQAEIDQVYAFIESEYLAMKKQAQASGKDLDSIIIKAIPATIPGTSIAYGTVASHSVSVLATVDPRFDSKMVFDFLVMNYFSDPSFGPKAAECLLDTVNFRDGARCAGLKG